MNFRFIDSKKSEVIMYYSACITKSCLKRVIVNAVTSGWQPATNGVPKGFILRLVLFNIFINYLDTGLEGILSNSTDDTELGGAVHCFKGRNALKRDLSKSERWEVTNHVQYNKVLDFAPGMGQPWLYTQTGEEDARKQCCGKGPGVLVDGKVNLSSALAARRANPVLGGTRHSITARQGRDCPALL
ncbi:hypothetical protein TURU_065771 [Turdus rufiventris]|nr:hypothetical protein TURU_065771 [Turdus rufiventris]